MPIEFAFPLNHILIPDRMSTKTITTNTTTTIRACPNRTEIVNRKSKSIRFRECFGRSVQTESKRENRNATEKHGRAAIYGPFKAINTCGQSSVQQHRSTRAVGMHDDVSTPGGRWASSRGGGASNVDAPGSNFKLYSVQ